MLTSTRVDAQLLADAKKLKVVSTVSVGYDAFDVAAFQEYGVLATHTPYVLDETVADLVLGLMILPVVELLSYMSILKKVSGSRNQTVRSLAKICIIVHSASSVWGALERKLSDGLASDLRWMSCTIIAVVNRKWSKITRRSIWNSMTCSNMLILSL